MPQFVTRNWKAILFPVVILLIITFDQCILGLPWELTTVKVFFISSLHVMLVLKTKYLFDSDIYNYLSSLKLEHERCFIIKPFLSNLQTSIIFGITFILFLVVSHGLFSVYTSFFNGLLILCLCALFANSINEMARNYTNRSDLGQVRVPPSIQQRRFTITLLQLGTKVSPLCANAVKLVGTGLGLSEIGIPIVTGGPNKIGPVTHWITNRIYAGNEMTCPIRTRLDVMAEHAFFINQQNVDDGLLKQNPIGKRKFNLTMPKQIWDLGIDPGFPFSK
jgi:hypothetical protein